MRSTINLYEGDCLPAMKKMVDNQYDLVIVDVPYGIGEDGHCRTRLKHNNKVKHIKKDWDKNKPSSEYWEELFRVSENQIICGANYFTKHLPSSMGWIFWDKKIGGDFSDGEFIYTSFNRAAKLISIWCETGSGAPDRIHPTQKPVALYKWLLKNYAKPGDNIMDTHGGSMGIAIACWDAGHDLDLFEIDHDYFEAGKKRLEIHRSQLQINYKL